MKFSVIIPTVWQANKLMQKLISDLDNTGDIDEILIIDNRIENTPEWIYSFNKVKILRQSTGLYFNASVNLGVDRAKNELCCIINDDNLIDCDIFNFILNNIPDKVGGIFMDPNSINGKLVTDKNHAFHYSSFPNHKELTPYKRAINHGPGMFFCFFKADFTYIPEEIKHWYGDIFTFFSFRYNKLNNFLIRGFEMNLEYKGSTSSKDSNVRTIIQEDRKMYPRIMNKKYFNMTKKKYIWNFMGQTYKKGNRKNIIKSLSKIDAPYFLKVNKSWLANDSIDTARYKKIIKQSIFTICPNGRTSPDTFRLYEAIEGGSIPIIEADEYWNDLFGSDHPLIQFSDWNKAADEIEVLSKKNEWQNEYRLKLASWWDKQKSNIKQKINEIIPTRKTYNICFCCDENLIQYAINPINAICEKNTDNNIIIHFIYSGKEGDLRYIENALVDKSNIVFKKYVTNSLDIPVNKTWRSIEHLSNATNLKLQIPEILKDIDRVIYFDIDTIPYVNLEEFDSTQTDICGIAMRQEIKNGWRTFNGSKGTVTENKNPIDFGNRVIGNSGVMVLDLSKLRERKFTDFCIKEKQRNTYGIPFTGGDQDLINIFCRCDFNELPDKLNILVSDQLSEINSGKFKFKKFTRSTKQGTHQLANNGEDYSTGGVLHFIGKDKPWNSNVLGFDFWGKFNTTNSKIPKKIFQTWKTKDLNDGLSFLSKSFQDKNPEYEYFLYDDDDCRKFIKENFEPIVLEVYDRIIPGAFKADLWRCCALYIEGGIFCDMDMICMKSFDSIINDDIEFFAPIDSNSRGAHDLYNAFMGSIPGHPILKRCIDTIVDNVVNEEWRRKKQPPPDFCGCGVLGRSVNNYIGREDFSSFTGQIGVHDSVKLLNYVKEHRYVEDKEGNKYVWSKDGNKKIRMITRQAEKEYKAEPWILSLAEGKMPYKQKQSINFYEENPEKIIDYFGIDCQLTNKSLSSIVREIKDKKCNCNMLVFGLGKDSIIYDTVNKGYTLFLETNQAWIDLNQNIKNKILYTFQTTVKDSLPINKEYLNKFEIPDFIAKTKWDIILIDAPPGDRVEAPGRALPIYWSSQIAKKHQTTIFIDDCCRDLEKKYCDKFFPEIHFNVKSDTERGDFRVYKQKQSNTLIHQHLETKQQQFIELKDQWKNFKDYNFLKYISNQLPKAEIPKNKFNTYNPNQKIAIVSLYTKEISDYAIYSEKSIKEYCEKQGYTFYIYREKLEKESNPNWSKAQALLNHIDNHEYIIWMDSDTLIFNPEKRFESIIQKAPEKFILATKDIGNNSMLNSGVLLFKSHQYTKNLIKRWRDFQGDKSSLYASGGDQEIFCQILKKSDSAGFNRKIFEMNEFNTDPRFVNNNTFILHFMSYPLQLKKIFISYWSNFK